MIITMEHATSSYRTMESPSRITQSCKCSLNIKYVAVHYYNTCPGLNIGGIKCQQQTIKKLMLISIINRGVARAEKVVWPIGRAETAKWP